MISVLRDLEMDGVTVLDRASANEIAALARRWSATSYGIVGMEFEDRYQAGILHHLQRTAATPRSHRCCQGCCHTVRYKPPFEVHQLHFRANRDNRLRAGLMGGALKQSQFADRLARQGMLDVPDDQMDAQREARRILARALLAHLDPEERALIMRVFEGPGDNVRNIARDHGVPMKTMSERIQAILDKLRHFAGVALAVDGAFAGVVI